MAEGVPVFVYDHFGGPGWLSKQNLERAEYFNFNGKCTRNKRSARRLWAQVLDGYSNSLSELEHFQNHAMIQYEISSQIRQKIPNSGYLKAHQLISDDEQGSKIAKHLDYLSRNTRCNKVKTRPFLSKLRKEMKKIKRSVVGFEQ
ncbi:hypothetical protein GCM10007094_00460 [Pseudovibrio japonicus]|uniref:Uncharacterized protein n=2 Tax=Pseudovibrio japonicus TaxID=366534 RepID=A0ABQ3DVY6_9HYPH|nr:hypothetical protein GCM10007094_00460 [Pseudovibrio japonicus]